MRAFSTKVPLGAAARAAAMRSTASSMPNSPPCPASSILAPTAPSSTARATVRPTSSAVSPYPASRSAVTGTLTAATMRPTCSSIVSRSSAPPSGTPQDQAMPALVVAMAGKPTCSRMRAEPASQAFGSTKPGPACRARRAAALSFEAPVVTRPSCRGGGASRRRDGAPPMGQRVHLHSSTGLPFEHTY